MKHNFKPYMNPVFIETGSYVGDGIKAALDAGFKQVISIELSVFYYEACKERFKDDPRVFLYFGDSLIILPEILNGISKRCTFWLDGHFCGDFTASGIRPVPLMEELQIIAGHHIKNHIILIDDMRLLRNKEAEWKDLPYCVCDVEEMIYSINKDYKITYDFGVVKDDILIARV